MRAFSHVTAILLLLLVASQPLSGIFMDQSESRSARWEVGDQLVARKEAEDGQATGTYLLGSSLPRCSHACGPCFPCRRVMVSLKCLAAESCPVAYRCRCRGRYYHVPSG